MPGLLITGQEFYHAENNDVSEKAAMREWYCEEMLAADISGTF